LHPIEIPAGHTYDIEWDGPGNSNVVECFDDENITFRGDSPDANSPQGTVGPFGPLSEAGPVTHVLCIQTASGNVLNNLTVTTYDESGEPEVVELELANEIEGACGNSDEDGCTEPDEDPEEFKQEGLGAESPSNGETLKEEDQSGEKQSDDAEESADKPVDRESERPKEAVNSGDDKQDEPNDRGDATGDEGDDGATGSLQSSDTEGHESSNGGDPASNSETVVEEDQANDLTASSEDQVSSDENGDVDETGDGS